MDSRARDEWSVALDSTRARWEVAALMNRVLARAGVDTTVVPTAGGWWVRSATGRSVLADTVSQLWQASPSSPSRSEAALEVLGFAATPVGEVMWSAYRSLEPSTSPPHSTR